MTDEQMGHGLLGLTAQIVVAHVANNEVSLSDVLSLIEQVHRSLAGLGRTASAPVPALLKERPQPAVPIKKSVTDEYLVCLEDGQKMKMLKRHLQTSYDMTPEQYRERWGLPSHYPIVAPSYAKHRSSLAKQNGLGKHGGGRKKRVAV